MGEWGWVLGVKDAIMDEQTLKQRILAADFDSLKTRFLNNDAMVSMVHFGKGVIEQNQMDKLKVNTQLNPVLQSYYQANTWDMY